MGRILGLAKRDLWGLGAESWFVVASLPFCSKASKIPFCQTYCIYTGLAWQWTTDQLAKVKMWSWLWKNIATWINLALSNYNRIDLMSSLNQLFIETPYPKSQLALCTAHFRSCHSICWTQPQHYYLFSLCLSEFIREPGSNQGQEKKFKNSEC